MRAFVSRIRTRRTAAVLVVSLAAVAAVPLSRVAQASGPQQVSGSFNFAGKLIIGCPLGAVLCTSGTFTGGASGPFQFSITTLLPSTTIGVVYFDGHLVLHRTAGDIKCDLNGALNENTSSEGEFGEICVITGGTGAYAKATGDLRLIGTSGGGLTTPVGAGIYQGRIQTS
jgi:hypothetical protein